MGAGGLTSHLAAGPVNMSKKDLFQKDSSQLDQPTADRALSTRSLPSVSPYKHLKGGSERVMSVHARDPSDAHINLKSLSFRAPLFGRNAPQKVDGKTNSKYCNEEIVKSWMKDRDGHEVETGTEAFPVSEDHGGNDSDWNGTIRRTQSF